MKGTIVKYGLIGGLISVVGFAIALQFAGDPINFNTMEVIGYAVIFLSMLAIFFGIKEYRDQRSGGSLRFGKGVLVGVGISVIAALLLGIYTSIHVAWIDPNFLKNYSAWEIQKIETGDMGGEEKKEAIQKIEEMQTEFKSPLMQLGFSVITVLPIGILVSLLSAAILKRGTSQEQQED